MRLTTKQLVQTALILAICIASQFFKNLSVYLTGPIVNTTIIIATLAVSLYSGSMIAVLSPITAFFIAASPLMSGIPFLLPVVMIGNCILALSVWIFEKKFHFKFHLIAGLLVGSVLKALFLGIVVVGILLPNYGNGVVAYLPKPEALPKVLATAKITFSVTQLITSLTGSLLAFFIWIPLSKFINSKKEN